MMRSTLVAVIVAVAGAAWPGAQAPAGPSEPAVIAQGYTLLAHGDAAGAATLGAQALAASPESSAALTLLVDADIARAGSVAALGTYEGWLGAKRIEDAYVLRRIARASLREALANRQDPAVRQGAIKALAADGDPEAMQLLQEGTFADLSTLASLGDPRALNNLIQQLNGATGKKGRLIEALAASGNKLAIDPILKLLSDSDLDNRASAAEALGRLGATTAIPALRKLLDDTAPGPTYAMKLAAAGALTKLGDAAGIEYLRKAEASDDAAGPDRTYLKAQLLALLAPVPDLQWQNEVRALADDPKPEVRLIVSRLLAPYDNAAAEAMLGQLMGDANPAIRDQAADILVSQVATEFKTLRVLLRQTGLKRVGAAGRILELTR